MLQWRLALSDLPAGGRVPRDLYGAAHCGAPLLLRKGQLVPDAGQLSLLVESGLFASAETPPSVLHLLNDADRRLAWLLQDLRAKNNAEQELREIAVAVMHAVELNTSVALACIFLNQIGGSHAVRHSIEAALIAVLIAQGMRATQEETLLLAAAALTMHAGMLHQYDSFQNRSTPLTRDEMELVRHHPLDNAPLLKCTGVKNEEWIACVMLHHQPDPADGGNNRDARLIGLADRYCALVSARNYRRSLLPDAALRHVLQDASDPLDAALAQELARQLGPYPPGCLVRLQNGEAGVVMRREQDGCMALVHALRGADGTALAADTAPFAALRNTGTPEFAIAEALQEDQVAVRFSMAHVWGEQARL
jgi:hypothetical protein